MIGGRRRGRLITLLRLQLRSSTLTSLMPSSDTLPMCPPASAALTSQYTLMALFLSEVPLNPHRDWRQTLWAQTLHAKQGEGNLYCDLLN